MRFDVSYSALIVVAALELVAQPSDPADEFAAVCLANAQSVRFLGGIYFERDLNVGEFHRCYRIAGAGAYAASNNLAFSGDPDDRSGVSRPAARFDVDGRPLPTPPIFPSSMSGTVAIDTLRAAGVDLSAEPVAVSLSLTRDLGNTVRLRTPPGAGAWVLP